MPLYRSLGEIPPKRHTAFRKPDGSLYYEHLMGNGGFRGIQSILYSLRRPTTVLAIEKLRDVVWHPEPERGCSVSGGEAMLAAL